MIAMQECVVEDVWDLFQLKNKTNTPRNKTQNHITHEEVQSPKSRQKY